MQATVNLDRVEDQITWLRYASPDDVVEQTLARLRQGVTEDELWAAGALTACRYINNQAHNLLGFVSHALIGCEDARRLARNQNARTRTLLLVQALHQVVFDMHDPCMGPYELLPCRPFREASVPENIRMLRVDVRMGEYSRCDHRFVALEQDLERADLIDLLLNIGLEGITTDDHTLITPALVLGLCDLVGWEQGFNMLRCALRYSASFPRNFAPYDRAVELAEQYGLTAGAPTLGLQPERVETLRSAFLAAEASERPVFAARALAEEGCSPETVLAAVSLAGCDMYLMTEPVPHTDYDAVSREVAPIHIGTCTNALRDALRFMSPRTQAIAAIQGGSLLARGPSVLNKHFEFVPFEPARPYPYAEDVAQLRSQTPQQLIEMLWSALPAHDYRQATAVVRAYAEQGGEAGLLIAGLTAAACMDHGTLLHNVKHLNSMVEEFHTINHPDRWNYLIAATRFIAWYAGVTSHVYEQCVAALQ